MFEDIAIIVCLLLCIIALLQVPIAMSNSKNNKKHIYIHHINEKK